MILFKTLRYQNLLSSGNTFTEIDLTKSKTTLIVGENGAGKSSLIDALCYVLYGKPFRNINKPQLLNSITQKELLVEVEFSIGKKFYLIRRGMRPNIFEIYLDGTLINQNASMSDYQEMLERNIIKMNYKSFKQVVVLGSANYIPFMQLSPADRRQIIGDFLDIEVFTIMSHIAKERLSAIKSEIRELEYQKDLIEQKIELTQKHVVALRTNNQELIDRKQNQINDLMNKFTKISEELIGINTKITELQTDIVNEAKVDSRKQKLLQLESKYEQKIRSTKKEIAFFKDHDNCPTCKQGIDDTFKQDKVATKSNLLNELTTNMDKIEGEIESVNKQLSELSKISRAIQSHTSEVQKKTAELNAISNSKKMIEQELNDLGNNTGQITESEDEIKQLKHQFKALDQKKEVLYSDKEVLDVASTLLKDGGIKTRIIRQFIPVINKLINKYLAALDFFVNFELDEQFNETIKSRFRDEFSYASFSEGEKFRIDIALMLTWRAVAKLRNSASTNLLIMDEVFDGSLDNNGIEEFLKVLDSVSSESNIFVISHKGDSLFDKFDSVIRFEKHGNFSKIAA